MSLFEDFPDAWDPTRLLLEQIQAHRQKTPFQIPPFGKPGIAGFFYRLGLPEFARPLELKQINDLPCPSEDDLLGLRTQSLTTAAISSFTGGLLMMSPPLYPLAIDLCRVEGGVLPHTFGGQVWTGEPLTPDGAWRAGLAMADKIHGRDQGFLVGIAPDPIEGAQWLKSHLSMHLTFAGLPLRYKELLRSRGQNKAPVLVVNSMCDYKQYRVAPKVQLQVGKHASALIDSEYLFGSKRVEDNTKPYYGSPRNGFSLQNAPDNKPQTGVEFTFGTPTQYHREMMEVIQEARVPNYVANLRFPDQWMDVSIGATARAHILAGKEFSTLIITNHLYLPASILASEGVMGVALHRVTPASLIRLSDVLSKHKLTFNQILLCIAPVYGGINLMPTLERFQTALGHLGELQILGQSRKIFPRDISFYAGLPRLAAKLQNRFGKLGIPSLGFGEYLKIVREVSTAWPREEPQ